MQGRWLLLSAGCVLLAACASGPKKDSSESVALPDGTPVRREGLPDGRRSPYAPAREDVSKRGHYTAGGLYAPHIRDTVPDYIPNVDAIPEPDVRHEPRSRYGNRSPYSVLGKAYTVLESPDGFREEGLASYYGNKFHGRRTSNQEVYDMYAFTAAHKSLPLPSFARVTNLDNGKSVVVRVNDRGPFHDGRVIDLSYAAAVKLGYRDIGTARVRVEGLLPGGTLLAAATPSTAAAGMAASPAAMPTARAMDTLMTALPAQPARPAAANTAATLPAADATSAPTGTDGRRRFEIGPASRGNTDDFDAWMSRQQVQIATGKPQRLARPAEAPSTAATANPAATTAATTAASAPTAPPSPPAAPVAATTRPSLADGAAAVILQVAAFASQQNADQALNRLQQAGIAEARLLDGQANGQPVWRLRIGPVDAGRAAELERRVAGLGFGPPQRVRD